MLNQDPDALIGIADKMSADDFAVAPLPVGPSGKSYPTLGYAGWAMFADSQHKDDAWKLMATLCRPRTIWNGPRKSASSRSTTAPTRMRISRPSSSRAGSPSSATPPNMKW